MIRFTIEEDPFGKERPRGNFHTPARTKAYEKRAKAACQDVMRRHRLTPFTEPVAVYIDFRLKPPASMSKRKREAMLAGEVGTTGRYDIDNLAKAVLDAMNKVAFTDDRLICRLVLDKVASETVGVDVTVESYAQARAREREQQADVGGGDRPIVWGREEKGLWYFDTRGHFGSKGLGDPEAV